MSVNPPEKATAPPPNSAAAQLDKNCYAIFWTRTVLAESPEFGGGAKRGPIFSGGFPNIDLLPSKSNKRD